MMREGIKSCCSIRMEFQFGRGKSSGDLEMDGGNDCTVVWIYLIPLNCTSEMVKMANFMLRVFHYNYNNMKRSKGGGTFGPGLETWQVGAVTCWVDVHLPEAELSTINYEMGQLCFHRPERISWKSNTFQCHVPHSVLGNWCVDTSIFPAAPGWSQNVTMGKVFRDPIDQ